MNTNSLTKEVREIGEMHFEGNVIPHNWYHHIKDETTGKPELEAIIILSEILYWFRPVYVRDEGNGEILEVKKRFKGDALQKNKKQFAKQFGMTERKAQDSLALLEKLGLITREYRLIENDDKIVIANVLFIKIVPERIKEITFKNGGGMVEIYHRGGTKSTIPSVENYHITNIYKKKKKKKEDSIFFDYETEQFCHIPPSDLEKWKSLYLGVDVDRELLKMREWLLDPNNPERDGTRTFITNWLEKAFRELQSKKQKASKSEALRKKEETPSIAYDPSIAYGYMMKGRQAYESYLKRLTDQTYYKKYLEGKYVKDYQEYLKQNGGKHE